MNRSAFASPLALLFCATVATSAFAQNKPAPAAPAAPTTPAPAARAKFATPFKGDAAIEVIPGVSKFDPKAKEVVTVYKIKNKASGPIALLKLDEYWYAKGAMVSSDTRRYLQPFQPGEVIELTTRAPAPGNIAGWSKNATFTHANGKVTPKVVKQFQ